MIKVSVLNTRFGRTSTLKCQNMEEKYQTKGGGEGVEPFVSAEQKEGEQWNDGGWGERPNKSPQLHQEKDVAMTTY